MSVFQVPPRDAITVEEKQLLVADITNSVIAAFVALQQTSNKTEELVVEETPSTTSEEIVEETVVEPTAEPVVEEPVVTEE
jgi:hypothetical protein